MRQLRYKVYYIRYQVPFYLWQIKLTQKNSKLQRHVTDCLNIFPLYFTLLLMVWIFINLLFWLNKVKIYQKTTTNCSWNLFNISFWPKASMQNSPAKRHGKYFEVINTVNIFKFEGDLKELWAKTVSQTIIDTIVGSLAVYQLIMKSRKRVLWIANDLHETLFKLTSH